MHLILRLKSLILVILLVSIIPISTASAAAPPSSPTFVTGQTFAFQNVHEMGDMWIVGTYIIDWDSTAYTRTDAIGFLTTYGSLAIDTDGDGVPDEYSCGTTYGTNIQNPPFLAGGLLGFYLSASDVSTFGITFGTSEVELCLSSNPSTFSENRTSSPNGQIDQSSEWVTTGSLSATKSAIEDRLPDMIAPLETVYPDTVLIIGDKISAAGGQIAIAALSTILSVAPDAFTLSVQEQITSDIVIGNFDRQDIINTDSAASPAFLGMTSLASELGGMNRAGLGLIMALAMGLPVMFAVKKRTNDMTLATAAMSGILVWWALLGLMPLQIIVLIDIFCVAAIGIVLWRSVPTG